MFSHNSSSESCRKIRACLSNSEKSKNLQEKLNKYLCNLRNGLNSDQFAVAKECVDTDFFYFIIPKLELLDFDNQTELTTIFCGLMNREISGHKVTVERFCTSSELTDLLIKGSASSSTYLPCGKMLRECIHYPQFVSIIFNSKTVWDLFSIALSEDFDLSSSGFASMKLLFTTKEASDFFLNNQKEFFKNYRELIQTNNYVAKRESLHLLGDILLDKANYNVMSAFVRSSTNLKVVMNILIEKSKSVQFEAFHIFKLFLANPKKTDLVLEIFKRNKEQLLLYINNFHPKEEDEQLEQEKEYLIQKLNTL